MKFKIMVLLLEEREYCKNPKTSDTQNITVIILPFICIDLTSLAVLYI